MKGVRGDLEARDEAVLRLLLGGRGKKSIALELQISQSLVTYSVRRTFTRVGVENLVQLGAWAQREGLLAVPAGAGARMVANS
jgi:DNA-binding NarL/FixJ family response regulator